MGMRRNEKGMGAPTVVVADTGLFSLLGPSRTRCGSGSAPLAILDVP